MRVTNKKTPIQTSHNLHGHNLEEVQAAKYLGLTIQNNLKWDQHIQQITDKANKTLGFLRRNIRISSTKVKSQAYIGLVRPQLEYASTVWDPATKESIYKIEQIQRRAARYVTNKYKPTASVTEMIDHLKWKPLQQRRKETRLVMFYKIENNMVAIEKEGRLTPSVRKGRNIHPKAYQVPHSRIDAHKTSYLPQTIRDWNALPPDIPQAETLGAFKALVSNL